MDLINRAGTALMQAISEKVPLVLILGQDGLTDTSIKNTIFQHFGLDTTTEARWSSLLDKMPLPDDFYLWLQERYSRYPAVTWATHVSKLPWHAIFTSSFDPNLVSRFKTTSRSPQAVLTSIETPPAFRSLSRTPIYYLYGKAGSSDAVAQAPISKPQLRARLSKHTIPMLNRVHDVATAIGIIVIDGYEPFKDWLDLDNILTLIEQAPDQRVLWFGWKADDTDVPHELSELVSRGKIVVDPLRLGEFLAQSEVLGKLELFATEHSMEPNVISFGGDRKMSIPPELRIQVEASCYVVDDSWMDFLAPLGEDSIYNSFVKFHGEFDGPKGVVNGVRRGFTIVRDYEKKLNDLVKEGVENHSKLKEPVVLHGQSATGKSISLARLIPIIKEDHKAAILYTNTRLPLASEISEFCELAERNGASATLLICDCNVSAHRYRDLLATIRSRGRRVIVVGSSYRVNDGVKLPREFVEANSELLPSEQTKLVDLICKFVGASHKIKVGSDRNVLATLYRVLPSTKFKISSGLGNEARYTEQELRNRSRNTDQQNLSPIAQQLIALGLATNDSVTLENRLANLFDDRDNITARLVDLVMAAGQLNCSIPLNLLISALNLADGGNALNIANLFRGIDLFRWKSSDAGSEDILVAPRLTLEAEILCRRRLLTSDAEAKQLLFLIKAVRSPLEYEESGRRFLVDLLHKLGPDGPLKARYSANYVDIGRALTALRLDNGILDPRLMLQESTLRRSAIREEKVSLGEVPAILEEAREAVQSAIDFLDKKPNRVATRTRAHLIVERAAIFAFLAVNESKKVGNTETAVWSAYMSARTASQMAIGVTEAYNPLDVALWTAADLLKQANLSDIHKLELYADIFSVLDRIDPSSLSFESQERFNTRQFILGDLLELPSLSDSALQALERDGSAAGIFLKARQIGPSKKNQDSEAYNRTMAEQASEYLLSEWNRVITDERCLRYLLSCIWIASTGQWPLRGERQVIPDKEARRKIYQCLSALRNLGCFDRDFSLLYIEAVFTWLDYDEGVAIRLWRELSQESEYIDSRRVVKQLILADDHGRVSVFSGRVDSELAPGRFAVLVESLERRISVLERDFIEQDLQYGRTLSKFGIAFNYIGPIADPLHHEVGRP
ncbi:hypothetical protein M2404_003967 [Rheinheimera pacifica]|uniref:hypothetical protein n=1 Tax=Rheinheimera pacifica TaxID=173990 RepID=UPI0021699329|nr:hypothetical protein [Rheinheimera pacifica]MCS4309590.1 hypothetical protein [Rheinheimera pacifica]